MTVNGENITYLYDANDSRMYKQADTTLQEYYLKDLGHEILESYFGGINDPGGNYSSGFEESHQKALNVDPDASVFKSDELIYTNVHYYNFTNTSTGKTTTILEMETGEQPLYPNE